jgi:hypothetical protein
MVETDHKENLTMQITVPPNVPGGETGQKMLARMRRNNSLAALPGLDGVERLYRLTRRKGQRRLQGLGFDTTGTYTDTPAETVDLSSYYNQFGFPSSGVPTSSPPIVAASTPNTTPATSSWDKLWQSLIGGWSTTGQQILKQQNLPTGVYMQTGPNGTVYYTQPAGNQSNILAAGAGNITAGVGSGSMTPILLGGLGLLAVFVVMQMGRR